jgi:hypothetical protein
MEKLYLATKEAERSKIERACCRQDNTKNMMSIQGFRGTIEGKNES